MKKYKFIILPVIAAVFCITVCFIPIDGSRFIPVIEARAAEDYGVKIHIEKLILRLGPSLKVKAPIMHIMYKDGQKLGQFNNVKFFIPWTSLLYGDKNVKVLHADKFTAEAGSDDKYLPDLLKKLRENTPNKMPEAAVKTYEITYNDKETDNLYKISGTSFEAGRLAKFENLKVRTEGEFFINDKKYISYNVSILPQIDMPENNDFNLGGLAGLIKELDFHSDIIADLKLKKDASNELQISGLVNIDNISVADFEKKCPKSFIYLTFLGSKTGILSNIYAGNNQKIYAEGVINHSKKNGIDLRVKTDKINLADLHNKIKLIAGISRAGNIDSINGILAADFNIKGDINKIKSTGYLKISGAAFRSGGLNVNNINADMDFSDNTVSIANASGYINNAPVLAKGKINKNIDLELLMDKVELKHLCPASFGVQSGIVSLAADISGTLDNIVHKENLQIENFKSSGKYGTLSFGSFKINTNKSNAACINNIAVQTPKTELIKLPQLKMNVEHDTIKIPEAAVFMPNSKLLLKGEITNFNTNDLSFNFNLNGLINSKDFKNSSSYSVTYPLKLGFNGNKSAQNVNAQILMERALVLDEPAIMNFALKLENKGIKIEDWSILSFGGNFSDDFKSNLKGQKKAAVTGVIENLHEPVFKNIRIYIPQMLNISYKDTVAQLRGDLFINGKISAPEIAGQISVQNAVNNFFELVISNMTLDFDKNTAVLNAPQIKIGDSSLGVNTVIAADYQRGGLLIKNPNIKSKYINADTLLMYSQVMNNLNLTASGGKFYAEKASASLYGSPLRFTALTADFNIENNKLEVKNIASEIFNGKLAGSLNFDLKDESFNSKIQARAVSAAPLFAIISPHKDTVSGVMDFDSEISGNLASKQSLNGTLKFAVHNGRMGTLGKLEHLLYAQNVIADNMLRTSLSVITKAITLKDTGLFKYLRGDIVLQDGLADIKMLQSQGPLMSLFIKGVYNPVNDYAKLTVLGRLSDEIVSGLGVFGDFSLNKLMIMLTGEDNKYNILPEDFEKLPQLSAKNTKEFRSVIDGPTDKASSVITFNWVSYSQKSYRQKEVPETKVPEFIEALPY